jgi:hypothetical protein
MKHANIVALAVLALVIAAGAFAPSAKIAARQDARAERRSTTFVPQVSGGKNVSLPLITKHGASITNIADGALAAQTITVLGRYALEPAEDIWLFVLPPNNRYYPQSMNACAQEPTPKVNGKWEMRATLGVTGSVSQTFQLITTVATPQASRLISETLRAWCQAGDYPGFEQLPQGVTPTHTIAVTRTAERWGPAPPVSNAQLPGQVALASPLDGAAVPQTTIVSGTYSLDVVNDIWVLVYATNGRWYPQSSNACAGEPARKADGTWQVDASFGGPLNAGEPFDIVAVLADTQASAFFRDTQRQWCQNQAYPGLLTIDLPQGIEEKSRIRVERAAALLVDDYTPQPIQGKTIWPLNRLGGDRGRIDGPGSGDVSWGHGVVTATITAGTNSSRGVWTSLNHPISDCVPLDFSALFPPQINPQYQARMKSLRIRVLDGRGTFRAELQHGEPAACPPQITRWSGPSVALSGGPQNLSFDLPLDLGEIQNLNWQLIGGPGDFVVVDQVELDAQVPYLTTRERAFLWSYAMLLANRDPRSGLTRDGANFPAGEFDNVSASGMQTAAAVMAWRLGFISELSATEIVTKTTQALLALPRCHGLWPHFVKNGQIISGTEWSSIDTTIAMVALLEARAALGLEIATVEQALRDIDWPALMLGNGSISHGYMTDCLQLLEDPAGGAMGGWRDFGTESWLVNLGYAAATGNVATFDHMPPTYNGSGFIDELAWLLAPRPCLDQWGTAWCDYSEQAADRQLDYYREHPCYGGPPRLFGLSAAEVPDLTTVPVTRTYQAFGVGGVISPTDGVALFGHAVIVPHYAGMIAALRPAQAFALWEWLVGRGLLTPLNNVESFMFTDEPTCSHVVWDAFKGSWDLSLQTLGWGRLLAGDANPLYQGMLASDMLRQGYTLLVPAASRGWRSGINTKIVGGADASSHDPAYPLCARQLGAADSTRSC